MARYTVSALKAVDTPAGAVLDRIIGPGWLATPASLLDMMAEGGHDFVFDDGVHTLELRRDGAGNQRIVVINQNGSEVAPSALPQWQTEVHRGSQVRQRRWWQRLLDPDAQ